MPATIDRFLPHYDVRERFGTVVRAPAELTFEIAGQFEMESIPLVHAIVWMRGVLMGSKAPAAPHTGFFAMTTALGWGTLARVEGRELVAGAVTQPWLADVKFTPVPAERFAAFDEPGLVKIVWTLETEPIDAGRCRLFTETRALATDGTARRLFLRYWRWVRFGSIPIRWLLILAIRREAERRYAGQNSVRRTT
jgi:hypothetical protein